MSLRKFMHERNKYKEEPNFKKLAILYPEFRKIAITVSLYFILLDFNVICFTYLNDYCRILQEK